MTAISVCSLTFTRMFVLSCIKFMLLFFKGPAALDGGGLLLHDELKGVSR